MKFQIPNKGISIYLALIIMTLMLALSLGISAILLSQIKMLREMENSVIAFYAADTGIERALYENPPLTELPKIYSDNWNGVSYQVGIYASSSAECLGSGADYYCIKSLGIYKAVRRSIQVTF